MGRRVVFDVYGRFRVTAEEHDDGTWVLYQSGTDGKRRRMRDVTVPECADLDEVERSLEAAFHEVARPGTSITRSSP